MNTVNLVRERLGQGEAIVLDGALGTELVSRGIRLGKGSWSAHALHSEIGRGVIGQIHGDYLNAGADIITTNTFRTPALGEDAELYTLAACAIARRAREEAEMPEAVIAGSAGPAGDCYKSADRPSRRVLWDTHRRHAQALAAGGVDLYLAETMNNLLETEIALTAAQEADLPIAVSFFCEDNGRKLESGETLRHAAEIAKDFGAVFVAVNCVDVHTASKGAWHLECLDTGIPTGAFAQGYDPTSPTLIPYISPEEYRAYYVSLAEHWVRLGVQVVGGCCGVTPGYIADIAQRVKVHNATITGSISATERLS